MLVLVFAVAQGVPWAGVTAVLAMALGTALTTTALACLAVFAKRTALRARRRERAGVGSWPSVVSNWWRRPSCWCWVSRCSRASRPASAAEGPRHPGRGVPRCAPRHGERRRCTPTSRRS
ncbi:hypothetical protein ACU4GR_26810 [Methylobacterium oryzae CBMB20]